MKISTYHGYDNDFIATDDQVTNAVNKFRNHSSIIMIKNKKKNDQSFSFGRVTYDDVLKIVNTKKKNSKIKFKLFCRIFLRKYQPVYLKINIPIRSGIS